MECDKKVTLYICVLFLTLSIFVCFGIHIGSKTITSYGSIPTFQENAIFIFPLTTTTTTTTTTEPLDSNPPSLQQTPSPAFWQALKDIVTDYGPHPSLNPSQAPTEAKPIYLYNAGVEGSTHHGLKAVIEVYLQKNGYEIVSPINENCEGADDTWIIRLVEFFHDWGGDKFFFDWGRDKGKIPVFFRNELGSFPACRGEEREELVQMIDIEKPIESIRKLLPILQQKRHPSSLLQHASFSRNSIERTYDFRVIWIQRDFVSAVWSRYATWELDGSVKKHAVIIAVYELYIATELRFMENSGLGTCVKLYSDLLASAEGQTSAIRNMTKIIPGSEKCDDCFKEWKSSSRDPYASMTYEEITYLRNIAQYVNEIKSRFQTCQGMTN